MALNSGGVLMEPETIVLYNDPLLLSPQENVQNNCTLIFKTINNDMISNSTLIFDSNVYQIDNEVSENCSTETNLKIGEEYTFYFENKTPDTDQNINMMNFFYKNAPKDQPEFVDVNNLTDSEYVGKKISEKENFVVSDDENDVIFVKEYKSEDNKEHILTLKKKNDTKEEGIRRNPVRKARTNKGRRHLQKEHLLEEDFAFLDQFDEDNLLLSGSKSSSSTTSATSPVNENFKEWPENCYERPEYNSETNKIEPFDFTIREIQNNQQKKKPRLETCPKVQRKPKKKYFIRKRKPKAKKAEQKIPVNELKEVLSTTFNLVGEFVHSLADNEGKSNIFKDGLYNLLKNQTSLMAVIRGYGEKEITKCVSELLGES